MAKRDYGNERTRVVTIRLSNSEVELLMANASELNISLSDYIRRASMWASEGNEVRNVYRQLMAYDPESTKPIWKDHPNSELHETRVQRARAYVREWAYKLRVI